MSQSLREKLSRIYGAPPPPAETGELRAKLERISRGRPRALAEHLGGQWKERPSGRLLTVDRFFPLHHRHGIAPLSDIFSVRAQPVRTLAGNGDFKEFDPRRTLFLDTETTGLAGGAGTCVFLVGLGYFEDDRFRIRQLFLPGYEAERAFLEELNDVLVGDRFGCLVSFNGKSYDLNLLENRFVMQRLPRPFDRFDHLDLLHPSRLLWKERLQECGLQTLERRLLRLHRKDDIPSAMIPGIYFRYLHSGKFQPFDRVFEHNRIDLLTMVGLLTLAARLVEEPDERHYVDHATAARIHQLRGNFEKAEELLEEACADCRTSAPPEQWVANLAYLKKRLGKYDEALPLFLQIVEASPRPPVEACREAAKILEHVRRDFQAALDLVRRARKHACSEDLKRREFRLECRLAGRRWY